jgi:hypothetical protein
MRFLIVAGALVAAAGPASAAYLVELDGGDRMTVDSYWEDGDRIHLMRDGVDLNVLRSRVRTLRQVDDPHEDAPAPAARVPDPSTAGGAEPTREELEAQRATIEKHMLRVQQERFEAEARGDDEAVQRRLQKEFQRTQTRRLDVIRALQER